MNQYFICNGRNFPDVLRWATQQARKRNVQLTAYCDLEADRIMRNADGPHEWDIPYDFVRTATSVMRLGLLIATGLDRYYRPMFVAMEENRRAFRIGNRQGIINEGELLAANRNETRLFFSYFDSMYAFHFIVPLLLDQPEGVEQRQSMRRQMIVVSPGHDVIWQITSTLYIVSDGERVLEAKTFVAVWRYDRVEDRSIDPLNLPLPDDDDANDVDNQNDVGIEEVVEGIRNMGLEDFLK